MKMKSFCFKASWNELFPPDYCLICHQKRSEAFTWTTLIYGDKSLLCQACDEKLQAIEGETCDKCSRPMTSLQTEYKRGGVCYDCFRWEEDEWQGVLSKNTSIYVYNDFLKDVIATYKFRGDYVLAGIFRDKVLKELKSLKPDVIIPIPLSNERQLERGFNQAEAVLQEAQISYTQPLQRIHSEKQSKKSRADRLAVQDVFRWTGAESITGKSVLLIDDVYTTGSTLRQAAKILLEQGAKKVQSLTIAR